jgi:2-polyprenyl-3-methyl-5-hydroxy-6-metoxy-1,4-benzoquinol methylase
MKNQINSSSEKRDVTRFFEGYAEDFYSIYQQKERPLFSKLNKWIRAGMFLRFEQTYQSCQEIGAKNLLDVGCGPGYHDAILAKSLKMEIMGIDVAENMIKLAKKTAKQTNVEQQCDFERVDFMTFQSEKSFDVVLSLGVVEYIMEPAPFVSKMMEHAEKLVIFSLPVKWHWLTPQRMIRYKLRRCPLRFYSYLELSTFLQQIGVTQYKIDRLQRDYLVTISV